MNTELRFVNVRAHQRGLQFSGPLLHSRESGKPETRASDDEGQELTLSHQESLQLTLSFPLCLDPTLIRKFGSNKISNSLDFQQERCTLSGPALGLSQQFDRIADYVRVRSKFTHFLGIPCPDLLQAHVRNVQAHCEVPEKAKIPMAKVHLTLLMMCLPSETAVKFCCDRLSQIEHPAPLKMQLVGLDTFPSGSPQKAQVLYTRTQVPQMLEGLDKWLTLLLEDFNRYGLHDRAFLPDCHVSECQDNFSSDQMHVSLVKVRQGTFNAQRLLKDHQHTVFGSLHCNTLNLYSLSGGSAGAYKVVHSMSL